MKEALKLALEALEFIPESGSMLGFYAEAKRHEAIIVIKEALAQPEQKWVYGTPLLDAMSKDYVAPQRQRGDDK